MNPNDFTSGESRYLDVVDPSTGTSHLTARVPVKAVGFAVNPGPQGPQGIQGLQGVQGPPGVVQTVSAGDASIAVGGTAADRFVSIAPSGVTNAHVANGALNPAKIAGNAATLGPNNFVGYQFINGTLEVAGGNLELQPSMTGTGTIRKGGVLFLHDFGGTFLGLGAGNLTMTGGGNIGIGNNALKTNTTGELNTATGGNALLLNNTGAKNTANGAYALFINTTGLRNTASGVDALRNNATGSGNTASGVNALFNNAGSDNTASGDSALATNTTGSSNTAIGAGADVSVGTLTNATAIGAGALVSASNALVLGNNANVGIGTSAPAARLDVVGDIRASGNVSAASFSGPITATSLNCTGCVGDTQLKVNYAGSASHGGPATNSLLLGGVAPSGYAPAFGSPNYVSKNGDLINGGLTVDGNLGTNGNLRVEGGVSASSAGAFDVDAPFSPGGRLRVAVNGNVGIGTASPARKLDVVGDASVSGTLSAGTLLGAGLSGMKEFTNDQNIPSAIYTWTAPPGVTHVMVDMWSGGQGGAVPYYGGRGGTYSRSIVTVVPGTAYTIVVGGGGPGSVIPSGSAGYTSSMSLGGVTLINAVSLVPVVPGAPDPNPSIAAISRGGYYNTISFTGLAAFGATFCLGPLGDKTGRGGDPNVTGNAGYVLFTW